MKMRFVQVPVVSLSLIWFSIASHSLSIPTVTTDTRRICEHNERQQQINPRLLIRKVSKLDDSTRCLDLLDTLPSHQVSDKLLTAALQVCRKKSDLETALKLYEKYQIESCRSLAISIAGNCGSYQSAIWLLNNSTTTPSIADYHSCMAACSRNKAWREALKLYHSIPYKSHLNALIVLTALANAKRGTEALHVFQNLDQPETGALFKTVLALIAAEDTDQAYNLIIQNNHMLHDSDPVYDLLISAFGKQGNWTMVSRLDEVRNQAATEFRFLRWEDIVKIGSGKNAFWKIGTFAAIGASGEQVLLTVGLKPNRNPAKNGIKIVLLENGVKIGFLLMINSQIRKSSELLGVFIKPSERKRGLSKILLAIWMKLCFYSSITPVTGIINKPLLCLVLQHTFKYLPSNDKGVNIEISQGENPGTIIIFASSKDLKGAFSPWDVKRERLVLMDRPPHPRGRIVHVKSAFIPGPESQSQMESVLCRNDGSSRIALDVPSTTIHTILLGKEACSVDS